MRKIDQLLADYGESHQHETNKAIHWICVPLIFFSVLGMIASIPSGLVQSFLGAGNPYANWATIAVLLVIAYYVSLSVSLTIGMTAFCLLCLVVDRFVLQLGLPLWLICIVIFVGAWIGQFYGHKVEGKKPSFLKDVQFLLIGPAWLMHFVYKRLGIPF